MKFSRAKRKAATVGLSIRKESGGWIIFRPKSKHQAMTFKTQVQALDYLTEKGTP